MSKQPENPASNSRRDFLGGSLGVAAGIGAAGLLGAAAVAQAQPPAGAPAGGPPAAAGGPPAAPSLPRLFRAETDLRDCEVEGKIPSDLDGAFYRVGPDAQYPLRPGNIPFDGEGHVGMFRI